MSASRSLPLLPLPPQLRGLMEPLGLGERLSPVAHEGLPVGVLSRVIGDPPALERAGLALAERCLSEGRSALWVCVGWPSLTLARALHELHGRSAHAPQRGSLTVLIALKLEAIPELLTALICSQGAPLLILAQEPIGLCPKLDARLAELSPKLARLCLMASVSLLCLSEPDQPIALGSQQLSSFAWSEVKLR